MMVRKFHYPLLTAAAWRNDGIWNEPFTDGQLRLECALAVEHAVQLGHGTRSAGLSHCLSRRFRANARTGQSVRLDVGQPGPDRPEPDAIALGLILARYGIRLQHPKFRALECAWFINEIDGAFRLLMLPRRMRGGHVI